MKIVISPAKSLDFETALPTQQYTTPAFLAEIEKLNGVLKKKTPKKLSELMSISDKLAQLNGNVIRSFTFRLQRKMQGLQYIRLMEMCISD